MFLSQKGSAGRAPSNLFVAVIFFLLLDGAMLALNLAITQQVDQQASAINLAGRQRMLSQRIGKALLQLSDENFETEWSFHRTTAANSYSLFASTLRAFDVGGTVLGAELQDVALDPVPVGQPRALVKRTLDVIAPLHDRMETALATPQGRASYSQLAREWADISESLLADMNTLVVLLEENSGKQTLRLRVVQGLLFLIATVNFLYIVYIFRQQHKAAQRTIAALEALLSNVTTPMLIANGQERVVQVNSAAQRAFNLKPDLCSSMKWRNLIEKRDGVDYVLSSGKQAYPIQIDLHELEIDRERFQIISLFDISRFIDREAELSRMAHRDPLTGLLNRRALHDQLEQEINRSKRTQAPLALMFIDLDGFKQINDEYGHDAGDSALIHITKVLEEHIRESDVLLRVGGDEFVLIAPDHQGVESIKAQAAKLVAVMQTPFIEGGESLNLGGSVGIAIYPDTCNEIDALLTLADAAMYTAKQQASGFELAEPPQSE